MNFLQYKEMKEALRTGTATPEQQIAAYSHIESLIVRHAKELREAERDSRDAYHEGRANAAQDLRGEPYGTY